MSDLQMLTGGGGNSLLLRRRMMQGISGGQRRPAPMGYTKRDAIKKKTWDSNSYLSLGIIPSSHTKIEISWYQHSNPRREALIGTGGINTWGWRLGYWNDNVKVYWAQNDWTGGGAGVSMGINTAICGYHYFKLNDVEYGWSDSSGGSPADAWISYTGLPVLYIKIWVDDVLVRDLEAYDADDGEAGLWDYVNGVFYRDATGNKGYITQDF